MSLRSIACWFACGLLLSSQSAHAGEPPSEVDLDAKQAERPEEFERKALPPLELPPTSHCERRLEVGGDFVYVSRPFSQALAPSAVYYPATPGFGIHLRWELVSWLRFHSYFVHAVHDVQLPPGALSVVSSSSISSNAEYGPLSAETFVFGAKLAPTLPLGHNARAWAPLIAHARGSEAPGIE